MHKVALFPYFFEEKAKMLQSPLGLRPRTAILALLQKEISASKLCQLFLLTECQSLILEELGQQARLLQQQLQTQETYRQRLFHLKVQGTS